MEKVILITGASSGFGLTTAQYLINKGYTVYGTSRKLVNNNNINMLQMDVCNKESITKAVNYIIEKEGSIDVVINNAGVGVGGNMTIGMDGVKNFVSVVTEIDPVGGFSRKRTVFPETAAVKVISF